MRLLAVDTAETSCSLALVDDGRPVCEMFFSSAVTHSRLLMGMVEDLVRTRAGIPLDSIDGFVTARGPGSFTGLRIGMSVVKGLAVALGKPAAGVSSLDGIALQIPFSPVPVWALMDARRGEVYAAEFRFSQGRLESKGPERVLGPEELAAGIEGPAVLAGSGALAYGELFRTSLGKDAWLAPPHLSAVRAAALARAVAEDPGLLEPDAAAIRPVYLRRSDAEINYERHPDRFC